MLDIQLSIPGILLPVDKTKVHRIVTVNVKGQNCKQCRGGIDPDYISQLVQDNKGQLKSTFLTSFKRGFKDTDTKGHPITAKGA